MSSILYQVSSSHIVICIGVRWDNFERELYDYNSMFKNIEHDRCNLFLAGKGKKMRKQLMNMTNVKDLLSGFDS
jgi:hypothetical protein